MKTIITTSLLTLTLLTFSACSGTQDSSEGTAHAACESIQQLDAEAFLALTSQKKMTKRHKNSIAAVIEHFKQSPEGSRRRQQLTEVDCSEHTNFKRQTMHDKYYFGIEGNKNYLKIYVIEEDGQWVVTGAK